jgi:hypothetical protein
LLFDKVKAAIETKYDKIPLIIRGPLNVLRKIALAKAKKGYPEFGRKLLRVIRKKAGLESIQIMVAGGGPLCVRPSPEQTAAPAAGIAPRRVGTRNAKPPARCAVTVVPAGRLVNA